MTEVKSDVTELCELICICTSVKHDDNHICSARKFEQKNEYKHYFALLFTTICFVMIGVSQIQINHVNLKDLNHYPNYLYEYFYRMIRVPLMYHLLIFILYIRNPILRKTVAREVQSWLRDNLGRRGEVFFRPERYWLGTCCLKKLF